MDTFDSDVLIYAAVRGHPLGRRVLAIFDQVTGDFIGAGSVLLIPEVLSKSLRAKQAAEIRFLSGLLARLDLRPVDRATAELSAVLAAKYRLRAADATHLATAVGLGAARFITSNKRDYPRSIDEVHVTYPEDLPDAES
jgi:predicted nucleic acid-binding protein